MAVKTITVTEKAYEALKARKEPKESFSNTILRIAGQRSLMEFAGALSPETGARLEKAIMEARKQHALSHERRIKAIVKAFNERAHGSP